MFISKRPFYRGRSNPYLRFRGCFRAAGLFALWCIASVVYGANWFFQPAVSVGMSYEENADLEQEDPINTPGYNLAVSARGGHLTERTQIIGNLNASFKRYSSDAQMDSDDYSASLGLAFLATELDKLNLNLNVDRDTSRTSELTTTGNISGNVPRYDFGVRAAWAHRLTERSAFSLGYEYSGVRFDSNLSNLIDSNQDDFNALYSYQLTERLDLSGSLGATFYDSENDQNYEGYDASLGAKYAFSETMVGNLDIGWQRVNRNTDVETDTSRGSANGFVYGFSLSKAFERSSVSVSLRRSVVPTGSGEPLAQERFRLRYSYQFSPRLTARFPIAAYRNEQISFGDTGSDERRIFVTTEPSLDWRVTEDVVLSATYRYQYEHFEQAGTSADGNAIFLTLSYIWPTEIGGLGR